MIHIILKSNKIKTIIFCLFTLLSCEKKNDINLTMVKEANRMIAKTIDRNSKNVIYSYNDIKGKDSIIGLAYGLPMYEKDKYFLKKIDNEKVLLIEKNISKKYFKTEVLQVANDSIYFRSKNYFPNIGEPYFINIYIENNKVLKVERQNVPD